MMHRTETLSPVERRIEEWRQRLIDLTRRNRLLYFQRNKSSKQKLIVSHPDTDTIFNRLVVQERAWKFWLPPSKEAGEVQEEFAFEDNYDLPKRLLLTPPRYDELVCEELSRKELELILKNLYRRAKTDYQERGVRVLYAAFGLLTWRDKETSDYVHSPLVLCPVQLTRETARDPFLLTLTEEEIVLNPALQAILRRDFNLELPPILEDWEQQPISKYLDSIAQFVSELKWSVETVTLIAPFSFHKLVMYQDLAANALQVRSHSIICALGGEQLERFAADDIPDERQLDSIQQPKDTFQILDADSSQQQCIQAALRGRSLVLQGPPGTGKSQTIANIICEFIARGKTVLFVSEKIAALEVVFKRLRDKELEDFCLELHSHKADKRKVVAELKRSLDEYLAPQRLPSHSDFEKLKQLRKKLNEYVLALHSVREPLGESARCVLGRLAALNAMPMFPLRLENANHLCPSQIQEWEQLMQRLSTVWHVIEGGEDFPWLGCRETQFTLEIREQWVDRLRQLASTIAQQKHISEQFSNDIGVDAPSTLSDAAWVIQVGNHLNQSPGPHLSWLTSSELDELFREAELYRVLSENYWRIRNTLLQYYHETFFELQSGMGERIKAAWESIALLLAPGDPLGRILLEQGQLLLDFLERTKLLARDCSRDAIELCGRWGLSAENTSSERARELAQLAILCNSQAKPEADWLNPVSIQLIRNVIRQVRPKYEEYNNKKRALLVSYDESFFDLDVDELIEHFSSFFYRSPLRWLHPRFYKDKRIILRTTRTPALPTLILDDLLNARELVRLHRRLNNEREQVRALLKGYDRGYDTDFDLAENALDVAADAIKLAGIIPLPDGLIKAISLGTVPASDLYVIGSRILENLDKWEKAAQQLSALVPEDNLPGTDIPLRQSSLSKVEQWAQSLYGPLKELCELIEQVLSHQKGSRLTDFPSILETLNINLRNSKHQ